MQPRTETAYIGLGSNLSDPVEQLRSARAAIAQLPETAELLFSPLYRNPPMGPAEQPDFVNAAMAVATGLEPLRLLRELQRIELEHGRLRTGERWGPRTLDLDLLVYGDRLIEEPELVVPHPGLAVRAFVLYPLRDIAPDLRVPGLGLVRDLVAHCRDTGMVRVGDPVFD